MIIDKNLRDMILFIYHHFHNLSSRSGGGGNVTTSQLNTALADKLDKGGYTGTAQDLKNASDTVDSKTIHWNDVQNKPELDFIPTSWNKKNNKEVIRTQVDNWLRLNDQNTHTEGVYLGESVVRTDGQLQVGPNGNVFRTDSTVDIEGIILGDEVRISKHGSDSIVFGDAELTQLVYGEFKGIKIWNNADNNKVVLAGGGVKPLSELDNKNIKVGGRNLLINSGQRITNSNYNLAVYKLTEELKDGEQVTLTIKGQLGTGKTAFAAYNSGDFLELSKLLDKGNGFYQNTFIWKTTAGSRAANNKTLWVLTYNEVVTAQSSIEWIKLEKGNSATDWTPAFEDYDFIKPGFLLSELNTFKRRETGGYYVNFGGGTGILLSFEGGGSTSSLEFYKANWYPETRIQVRNTVDGNRFNDDNESFRELAWFSDIARAGGDIGGNWTADKAWQNGFIFVRNACNIELNQLDNMGSIFFRKVFVGGNITFTCAGKTIIYTNGSAFNGGDGSTATVSIFENKCYIDIKNV